MELMERSLGQLGMVYKSDCPISANKQLLYRNNFPLLSKRKVRMRRRIKLMEWVRVR